MKVRMQRISVNPDGSTTWVQDGAISKITVPGAGLVYADIGRLVIYTPAGGTPQAVFEAGQHDDMSVLLAALCQYLV